MKLPDGWGRDDRLIACHRVSDCGWHYPEAVEEKCSLCGEPVWAGPPTVEQGHKPGWHIVCLDCLEDEPCIIAGHTNRTTPYPWREN